MGLSHSWEGEEAMDVLIAGLVVLGLLIYLAYSLIYPEKF